MSAKSENTLLIIKPDYMEERVFILQLLHSNGFRFTHRKIISFSPEQAAEFYKNLEYVDPLFALKVMSLAKGSAEAVIVNKVNAIEDLSMLVTSLSCPILYEGMECKIHVSMSEQDAKDEIRFIFPNVIPKVKRELHFGFYCGRTNITGLFADATFEAFENKTPDVRSYTSHWLLTNSYKFESDNC